MKVFNSKDIIFIIGGKIIKDFSAGGIVKVEYLNSRSELISGVNEETIFVNNGNLAAKISFALWQNSDINLILNAIMLSPVPVLPVYIKSKTTFKYHGFGIKARIANRPITDIQRDAKEIQWEILVADWYSAYI